MTINIGINGYGRIGRNILRALYESNDHNELKIVAINDVGDNSVSAHLTMYDSAHGKFNKEVKADENFMYVEMTKFILRQKEIQVELIGRNTMLMSFTNVLESLIQKNKQKFI